MVVEHMKSVLLQELIKREMHQTDFIYNDDDRAILSRMFDDLNSKTGANYHYLAEIAFQLAPNIGTIILCTFLTNNCPSEYDACIFSLTIIWPPCVA